MDKKDIEELIAIMDRSNLSEIEIADGNTKIVLRKSVQAIQPSIAPAYALQPQLPSAAISADVRVAPVPCENLHIIKSPMVGTFYASSAPDSDPFVRIGSRVEGESTVCVLEAMKVMNEIQAEVTGVVREVLVKNGQPVEFGQPLFKIEIC